MNLCVLILRHQCDAQTEKESRKSEKKGIYYLSNDVIKEKRWQMTVMRKTSFEVNE